MGSRGLSRRGFLSHSAMAVVGASVVGTNRSGLRRRQSEVRTVDIGGGVTILGRDAWGADHPPTRAMTAERPEDVGFLLVHHTVSSNTYRSEDVAGMIRSFYSFHSGREKKWADVAYNFLIDRFGRVWEARAGSIDRPMKGAATGGSQGHAMLCSFIGDHMTEAPSAEAQNAMVHLLAWLADKYEISTAPGAAASFVSRGSNRHPEGTTVVTPTIQGHRGMSLTSCPGDACFALVENEFPARVEEIRSTRVPATSSTTTTETTTTTTSAVPPTTVESTTSTAPETTSAPDTTTAELSTTSTTTTSTTSPTTPTSTTAAEVTSTTAVEPTGSSTSTTDAAGTTITSSAAESTATSVPPTTVPPTTGQVDPTSTSAPVSSTTVEGVDVAAAAGEESARGGGIGTLGAVGGSIVVLGAVTGGIIARRRKLATETTTEPGTWNEPL